MHLFKFSRLLVSTLKKKRKDILTSAWLGAPARGLRAKGLLCPNLDIWTYLSQEISTISTIYSHSVHGPFINFMLFHSEAYTPFPCTSRSKYPINPRPAFPQTKSL